jgi:hypothetical protein
MTAIDPRDEQIVSAVDTRRRGLRLLGNPTGAAIEMRLLAAVLATAAADCADDADALDAEAEG